MYGQYNPYMGATPQMQQRLNYLQQQQQQMYQPTMQQPMPMALKGRIVTSMDEAKAAQIDLDGTSTFFPCPAEGKIYEKLIGLDGLPIFRERCKNGVRGRRYAQTKEILGEGKR